MHDQEQNIGSKGEKFVVKKTPKMLSLEKLHDEVPIEGLLSSLYLTEEWSLATIGIAMGTKASEISRFLHHCGFKTRSVSEGAKVSWKNPNVAEKRQKGLREYAKEHVGELTTQLVKARKKHRLKRLEQAYGKDYQSGLQTMVNQGITNRQITTKTGVSIGTVSKDRTTLGVKPSPKGVVSPERIERARAAQQNGQLEKLTKRQQEVLKLRFPLTGRIPTQKEVAENLGCARQAISGVEQVIFEKI